MKKVTYAIGLVVVSAILWACTKDLENDVPSRRLDMATLQVDYTDLINKAAFGGWNMPTTNNARVALGRALFYDNKLSLNNTVSCGSCHKQQFGLIALVCLKCLVHRGLAQYIYCYSFL